MGFEGILEGSDEKETKAIVVVILVVAVKFAFALQI